MPTKTEKEIDYNVRSYPELDRIAQRVADTTLRHIREQAAKTPDYGMRYVQQYVLEEVVAKLQARI